MVAAVVLTPSAFAADATRALPPAVAAAPAAGATLADAMPMPDRALLFGGDISRLIATQPLTSTAAEPASGGRVQNLLKQALALLGTPYRWGGTSPKTGFDCSGLIGYVFRTTLGIELPRVSGDLAQNGLLIPDRAKLSPGDLVFFGKQGKVDHAGIYVGADRFVHAPRTGKNVMVSSLEGYWGGRFLQGRRVAGI